MRLISISELKAQKGISYSRPHIYRLMAAGAFPKALHVGGNRIAFLESEIDDWIRSKVRERDAQQEAA